MAEIIRMPKMSDTMTEGVIARWLVKPGDSVESGTVLAEVETDKAVMELESYEEGIILYIGAKDGQSVPVDDVLAVVGEEGEPYDHLIEKNDKQPVDSSQLPASATEKKTSVDLKAVRILMPKMSDTMTEGVISKWLVKVGDAIQSGDILAEVETDKATMELESYEDGEILYLGAKEGEAVKIDDTIAIVGEKGAAFEILLNSKADSTSQQTSNIAVQTLDKNLDPSTTKNGDQSKVVNSEVSDARIRASPLARRLAKERSYNLRDIKGTGKGQRIIKRDIENYKPESFVPELAQATTFATSEEVFEDKPISQMRSAIAKSLSSSKFTSPHFYITVSINMDEAIQARKKINAIASSKISFNDFIIKAVALSLRKHPGLNTQWLEDDIRYYKHVHIGVAVAIEDGLIVPVIRFADQKSLGQISAEVKTLASAAKARKLQPEAWQGSTFTISNLGMFGVDSFTAIINTPNACILAIGVISAQPIVKENTIVPGNIMKVTLSCDHRIVDGATGSKFLQSFKALMENPITMLM